MILASPRSVKIPQQGNERQNKKGVKGNIEPLDMLVDIRHAKIQPERHEAEQPKQRQAERVDDFPEILHYLRVHMPVVNNKVKVLIKI